MVECGLITKANGHLYAWGRGFSGTSDANHPQCVPSSLRFTQATFGWNHALLLSGMNLIFSFSKPFTFFVQSKVVVDGLMKPILLVVNR